MRCVPMTSSELLERISINNSICHGKPCIKETRVMVHQVIELSASSMRAGIMEHWNGGMMG